MTTKLYSDGLTFINYFLYVPLVIMGQKVISFPRCNKWNLIYPYVHRTTVSEYTLLRPGPEDSATCMSLSLHPLKGSELVPERHSWIQHTRCPSESRDRPSTPLKYAGTDWLSGAAKNWPIQIFLLKDNFYSDYARKVFNKSW